MDLVAGRECGECSACCVVLNVDTPEFQKMPGRPCVHLRAKGGCSIHPTRFPVCRAYFCGWRYLAMLGDDWRPDRSGVILDFQTEGLPDHIPKRPGIRVMVFGPPETALRPALLDWIARLVAAKVPVILAAPGPPDHFPAGALLNDALNEAVARRDFAAVQKILAEAFKGLEGHRFNPVMHRHGKIAEDQG